MEKWLQKDPIKKFKSYLIDHQLIDRQELDEIRMEAEREVADAHVFAKNSPDPNESELTKYVFKEK